MAPSTDPTSTRRQVLLAAAGLAAGVVAAGVVAGSAAGATSPIPVMPGLDIYPRAAWGVGLAPTGPLAVEDSRFLIVHHTESPNSYTNAADVIRGVYAFHTSSAKGWPDVCYNFFVGRAGDVWEGRAGSLDGPIVADATGGSQGFGQLVCLLGSYISQPPTDAALQSLVKVLTFIALRDNLSLDVGATASFVSRGSNKIPLGKAVTTPIIVGHRDMTYTDCPGDGMYVLLPQVRSQALEQRDVWRPPVPPMQPDPRGWRGAKRLGVIAKP